jgi:hypothetical protein
LELTVTVKRPECLIGHSGPLAVCVWRGPATVPALRALVRSQEALVERHGRISTLAVVRPFKHLCRPDPEVEDLERELVTTFSPRSVGTAVVIEGSGAAAAISHVARARLLPHCASPNEAFGRVADALRWLAQLPGQDPALYAAFALASDVELLGRGDD